MNIQLYGKDNEEHIVGLRYNGHGIVKTKRVDNVITEETERFFPFFFLRDINLIKGFPEKAFKWKELQGNNAYKYLCVFNTWRDYKEATSYVKERGDWSDFYAPRSPEEQYMTQTGKTLFKGMRADEVHRLQLDIETYSKKHSFPDPDNKDDIIIIVALSDNRGYKELLQVSDTKYTKNCTPCGSEEALLNTLIDRIQTMDPDVIEGHNIFNYDFDYIRKRCELYDIDFAIGRGGTLPFGWDSGARFAERTIDFKYLEIPGRHIVDTYFLVMEYDVYKRDMPSHTLKASAKYFGFAPEGREYVRGDLLSETWEKDPERILRYALDDVYETRKLSEHLNAATFYLTQMLPLTYNTMGVVGNGRKIESLFVREYLRMRHSIPQPEKGLMTTGGMTNVFYRGVLGPILYADVESLYPSIMLNFNIQPESDKLNVFQATLKDLVDLRFEAKHEMRRQEYGSDEYSELDGRQNAYKIFINSYFGVLGFAYFLFNDISEADRVTKTGQKILTAMVEEIERKGGTVIEIDTDGAIFIPPDNVFVGTKEEYEQTDKTKIWDEDFVKSVTEAMPKGIVIGFDGRFKAIFSFKAKNYALLDFNDKMKIKGSGFKSRKMEAYGRSFMKRCVYLMLKGDIQGVHDEYISWLDKILSRSWNIDDFKKVETLKESLSGDEKLVNTTGRNRSAPYELAKRNKNLRIGKGDRIEYYITGTKKNVRVFENCKLAEDWDRDENTAYYVSKLDTFASRFKDFFRDVDFKLIFSPEDMFGFTPDGIEIQRIKMYDGQLESDTASATL